MPAKKQESQISCPLVSTMNIIGGKWKVPILWYLSQGPFRYNQLRQQMDCITNVMLTRSLRDLEEEGLILRIQHNVIPPHVEYRITAKGEAIIPAIRLIADWGNAHLDLPPRVSSGARPANK